MYGRGSSKVGGRGYCSISLMFFLYASVCKLLLLDTCECLWKTTFIQLGNPFTIYILTEYFLLLF